MDLLKYEFLDTPEGSYNSKLKELVMLVRDYRSNRPIGEFEKAIPNLRKIEEWLQNADRSMGEYEKRDYIQEIMEELEEEEDVSNNFIEEVERASRTVIKSVLNTEFSIEDVAFNLRNSDAVLWVEYLGCNGDREKKLIVENVFQSVCYKNGILFVNRS